MRTVSLFISLIALSSTGLLVAQDRTAGRQTVQSPKGPDKGDPLSDLVGVYSHMPKGEPAYRVSKDAQGYVWQSRDPESAAWVTPLRLVPITESERARAAAKGVVFSVGLSMKGGSADQQFDLLRVDEARPGAAKIVTYVLYSWFGPNVLYKL